LNLKMDNLNTMDLLEME